jgi:magnesium-protoporphyrin O-methyltransferase
MSCCGSQCYQEQFGEKHAANDVRRYRAKGPDRTTRLLVEALKKEGVQGASLLDIGAGIGVVHHELLAAGATAAVHVDATSANIKAAQEETARRGHSARVRFLRGDFVALAAEIPPADIVTLDRVICCYPNMEELVAASAFRARRLYGAVFPRERWIVKAFIVMSNFARRLQRNSFRSYMHSVDAIDAAVARHGLRRCSVTETIAWRVAVYSR